MKKLFARIRALFTRSQSLDDVLNYFVETEKRLAEFEDNAAERINELDEELNDVSRQLGRAVRVRLHLNQLIAAETPTIPVSSAPAEETDSSPIVV